MSDESTTTENGVDYASMHWKQLKQLMEAEGQEFTNSAEAVAYLTALDAESQGPDEAGPDVIEEEDELPGQVPDQEPEQQETAEEAAAPPDAESVDDADDMVTADDLVDTPEDGIPPFNPDEPYGEVNGISNARYWQNGMHYTGQGEPILPEDVE